MHQHHLVVVRVAGLMCQVCSFLHTQSEYLYLAVLSFSSRYSSSLTENAIHSYYFVCSCMWAYVLRAAYLYVFLRIKPTKVLCKRSLTSLDTASFIRLMGQKSSGIFLSLTPVCWNYTYVSTPGFAHGC